MALPDTLPERPKGECPRCGSIVVWLRRKVGAPADGVSCNRAGCGWWTPINDAVLRIALGG